MRAILAAVTAMVLTACASTPPTNMTKVYDHKYNTYSYVATSQSEFVGTSATETSKTQPTWYRQPQWYRSGGHP
jgi:hypothetical protein